MDVATLTMDAAEAQTQLDRYRDSLRARRRNETREVAERIHVEDRATEEMLAVLAKGQPILDLVESMKRAGCKTDGYPQLAIARADQQFVFLSRQADRFWFGPTRNPEWHRRRLYSSVPVSALPGCIIGLGAANSVWSARAVVPTIPPHLRPAARLQHFHILWEAEWKAVPKDPILLRRISGQHFAVLAQWDLTEVERQVLAGRME